MMCECYNCIHNNGDGYCEDNSYITIMEDGTCDLMEVEDSEQTLENCSLIKQSIHIGVGRPAQRDGLCQGYSYPDDNEPCETCKNCKLCTQGYYQLGEES